MEGTALSMYKLGDPPGGVLSDCPWRQNSLYSCRNLALKSSEQNLSCNSLIRNVIHFVTTKRYHLLLLASWIILFVIRKWVAV